MMKKMRKQFSIPNGILGKIAGKIMALENKKLNTWTVSQLNINPHDYILEVGYGPGYCMEWVLEKHPTIKIDGIDISETMKEQAEKRLVDFIKNEKIKLWAENVEEASFVKESYDKVFSVNNYTIWNEPEKGLLNVYNALKPGGKIVITMQPREENASSNKTKMFAKQIHDDLIKCGFTYIIINFKRIRPELAVCVTAVKPI